MQGLMIQNDLKLPLCLGEENQTLCLGEPHFGQCHLGTDLPVISHFPGKALVGCFLRLLDRAVAVCSRNLERDGNRHAFPIMLLDGVKHERARNDRNISKRNA